MTVRPKEHHKVMEENEKCKKAIVIVLNYISTLACGYVDT